MQSVTLIRDPLAPPDRWERAEVADARDWLIDRLGSWPASARIYDGLPGQDRDITPVSEQDVERLPGYGELTVVVYPADPITAAIIAVTVIISLVATFLLMPKVPSLENQQQLSPNNGLSARSNRTRPNSRVPDIFGQVRSIPDLIAAPYRVYEDHRELEIAYMCIGHGAYDVTDVRDGETLVSDIPLASCAVYAPYSSPNDLTAPQLLIGSVIGDPVFDVARINDVNGQTLKARNDRSVTATEDLRFVDGGIVRSASGTIDFTDYFVVGDLVDVEGAVDDGGDASDAAILASAVAHSGGFDLASYNPTADFAVGNIVEVTGAVFQFDDGGTSGGLPGGTTYPSYPVGSGGGRYRGALP